MKKFTHAIFIAIMLFGVSLSAQVIPNANFENWTTNQTGGMQPTGWMAPMNTMAFSNVLQVEGVGGGSAAELKAVEIPGAGVIAPFLFSESFPVDQKYGKLSGYVKSAPLGNDSLYIFVGMYKSSQELAGAGLAYFVQSIAEFTEFNINIFYDGDVEPDSCIITFVAGKSDGFATAGSSFTVDQLSLSSSAGVGEMSPVFANIGQPYPSPATSQVSIPFALKEPDQIRLTVFDVTGKMVINRKAESFGMGNNTAQIDVSHLESGTYLCTIIPSDGRSVTRKFTVE